MVHTDPFERTGRHRLHEPMDGERILRRTVCQKRGDPGRIKFRWDYTGGKQGSHFAGEKYAAWSLGHVKRFDAHWISGEQHPPGLGMVEGEGKHAVELVERLLAPGR